MIEGNKYVQWVWVITRVFAFVYLLWQTGANTQELSDLKEGQYIAFKQDVANEYEKLSLGQPNRIVKVQAMIEDKLKWTRACEEFPKNVCEGLEGLIK